MLPWFIVPRSLPATPPALGGRGTERAIAEPRSGIRTLLFGLAARFGRFSAGRCTPLALPIADCSPFLPIVAGPPRDVATLVRSPPGEDAPRLTTGRAKLRGGGIAADLPAFAPNIVVRVGFTSS